MSPPYRGAGLTLGAAVFLFLAACSSSSSAPPGGTGGDAGGDATADAPVADTFTPGDVAAEGSADAGDGGDGGCPGVGTGGMQVSFGNKQCDSCMATNCCQAVTACYIFYGDGGFSDCAQLSQCVGQCAMDMTCIMNCRAMHPQSSTLYDDVTQCLSGLCGGGGGPCG